MDKIESLTSAKRTVARMADVLGAVPAGQSFQDFLRKLSIDAPRDVRDSVGTAAGAAAGYYLWKKHRWLGALGGASLGRNIPALMSHDRDIAVRNMGVTGTAVAGSLFLKHYPKTGFVLGWLLGGLVLR